ncbi:MULTISPECIES: TonB-dependent receptor [unclassified Sphingomonas]|jgi:iron complex outermembrane recepter protein|nr:TonB-dependent receptor [Sphingomonas sp. FARSPH]
MVLVSASFLSVSAEAVAQASVRLEKSTAITIDLPEGTLEASVALLAQQAGIAVAWLSPLPKAMVPRLRARLTPLAALRRLLVGTKLTVTQVGPRTYRIESRGNLRPRTQPVPRTPRAAPPIAVPEELQQQEIVVTARKIIEPVSGVPGGIAVLQGARLPGGRLGFASTDVALGLEGLSLTNLGPGRNRQFIRGVADSPFNGPSQSTVAVVLDEARITFDAPDPDLRLVDMERIELLKGPQGPLYGSGALGGVYHMVTRKPDLAAHQFHTSVSTEIVQSGGVGAGIEGIVNLPLADDRLAIRGVGYASREAGWIDRVGQKRNANRAETTGGRLAVRWQPDPVWRLDVAGTLQNVNTRDSRYVVQEDVVRRPAGITEPSDNDFSALSGSLAGRIGDLRLLVSSSYVHHAVDYVQDATDAAPAFGRVGPLRFSDTRRYSVRNYEARLSSATPGAWLIGASYMRAVSDETGTIESISRDPNSAQVQSRLRRVVEIAGFGNATLNVAPRVQATVGARVSHTADEDETAEEAGATVSRIGKTTLSPSLAVSWRPPGRGLVYLRYARAVRPGGLAPNATTQATRFDADELGSAELGYRGYLHGDTLRFDVGAFHTSWSGIQSDYLLPSGLVSTRNAGSAAVLGAEISVDWDASARLRISAGASYVDARLTRSEDGVEVDDRRLPITPDLSARLVAAWRLNVGHWSGSLGGQANYVGHAHLTFDPAADRTMGGYALLSANAQMSRDQWTVTGRIDNLLDTTADTFAFGNPFLKERQFTPLRPRTVTLSVSRSW